ncbi:MAG: ABC transporter substrate-binding protein [Chloroflexota bacterium]|nr:ABC transporter substrate-binding protein [Chloroflexota bacterium]
MKTKPGFRSLYGIMVALLMLAGAIGVTAAPSQQEDDRTLIIAVPSDIQNLDPTLSSGDPMTQEVLTAVYAYLIDFEVTEEDGVMVGDPNNFVGDVAESYEISDDGLTVTFHIRPGITFANGDPIDANAVKFTYDRIFGQGGVTAALTQMAAVEGADSIVVVDDLTVEFRLATANDLLFGNMAQFGHSILNPNVVEPHMTDDDPWAHEWLSANTTGTESGAYIIESREPGNQIVLARNPNYWREVANDRIILQIIPDASSRLAQLQAGAVDIAYGISSNDLPGLEGNPDITVNRNTSRALQYLGMNNTMAPFDNELFRQAISYAIPYETIIEQVLSGYGVQMTSPVSVGMPTHTDEFFTYAEDLDRARELLAESGVAEGTEITLAIPNDSAEARETAVWVQSNLREIGIEVVIDEMPGAAFTEQLQRREHAFFLHNWTSINNDPFYQFFWLLQSECCNYAIYENQDVSDLIGEHMLSTDAEAREEASREVQRLATEDAPWVFLYQPDAIVVARADVLGYTFYSADRYVRYEPLFREDWGG